MQYIYTLKLIDRLLDEDNWTQEDEDIVTEHFMKLKRLTEEGTVILAGRTTHMDETTFGIVILNANDEESARELASSDPAVEKGIMKASVYPYKIALFSADNIKQ